MTSSTFTVRGHRIRSASQRRYIVVRVPRAGYDFRPAIAKRSDSVATARKHADRISGYPGVIAVVVDSTTGEEV